MSTYEIVHYVDPDGRAPFERWFDHLGSIERAKVVVALDRLSLGNTSNVKSVGAGVLELRIHFGPGYRLYFGRDHRLVVLLAGGAKQRQSEDIARAIESWRDYLVRRTAGGQKDREG